MSLYDETFKPMLLNELEKPFDSSDYLFEMKFDGMRNLIFAEPGKIKILNRHGKNIKGIFPELDSIKNIVKNKVIFDGEIVLMDKGKPSFKKLQERALLKDKSRIDFFVKNYPVTYLCYDILYDNNDLTHLPLIERKKILHEYPDTTFFIKSKYILEKGKELFNFVVKNGMEGIVAKKIDSKYIINKRTNEWIKIKNWQDDDFYIGAYGINETSASDSLVFGKIVGNKLYQVGKTTIGKKHLEYEIIQKMDKLKKTPFENFNEDGYIYIKPTLKCTIEYLEVTKSGKLRQPIYKGLRLD